MIRMVQVDVPQLIIPMRPRRMPAPRPHPLRPARARVAQVALAHVPADRPPEQLRADRAEHVADVQVLRATRSLDRRAPREVRAAARAEVQRERPLAVLGGERGLGVMGFVFGVIRGSRVAPEIPQAGREGGEKVVETGCGGGGPGPGMAKARPWG